MKKKIIITVVSIFLVFAISAVSYIYYDIIVVDEYDSSKYAQEWVNDDGKITFTSNNKKGLFYTRQKFDCTVNVNGEKVSTNAYYDSLFWIVDEKDNELLCGDYFYIPILKILIVNVETTDDSLKQYKDEKIIFSRK